MFKQHLRFVDLVIFLLHSDLLFKRVPLDLKLEVQHFLLHLVMLSFQAAYLILVLFLSRVMDYLRVDIATLSLFD